MHLLRKSGFLLKLFEERGLEDMIELDN